MAAVLLLGILYMNKRKKIFGGLICLLFTIGCLFSIASCDMGTYFYQCVGVWSCEELTIESFGGRPRPQGTLKLDGEEYILRIAYQANRAHFYDKSKTDKKDSNAGLSDDMLIWDVLTELKKDKLYITVRKDYISDCTGKTYILQKQPE